MSEARTDQEVQLERLQAAYRIAFGRWARQVSHWRAISPQSIPESAAVREVRGHAEAAQTAYQESRNRLAEFMLAAPVKNTVCPSGSSPVPAGTGQDHS